MNRSPYIRSPEIIYTSENIPKIKTPVGVFSVMNDVNETRYNLFNFILKFEESIIYSVLYFSLIIKTTTSPKCRRNLFGMEKINEKVNNHNVYEDERYEK